MEEEQNLYRLIKSSRNRLLSIQNDRLRERVRHIESTMPHYNSIVQGITTWLDTRHENKYCFFWPLKENLFDPDLSGDYSIDTYHGDYVNQEFFVNAMRTTKNILAVHSLFTSGRWDHIRERFSGDNPEVMVSIGLALRRAGFVVQLLWYSSWRRGMYYSCYDWEIKRYGYWDIVDHCMYDVYDSGMMIFIDART